MVEIVHNFGRSSVDREVDEKTSFLLSNKIGGYFSLPLTGGASSKFQGLVFCSPYKGDFNLYKTIEIVKHDLELTKFVNNLWSIERHYGNSSESFFMPMHYNTLVYETKKINSVKLLLDFREMKDFLTEGRNYKITEEERMIVIEYDRLDLGYKIFLAIASDSGLSYKLGKEWVATEYWYDEQRGSFPKEWWVYDGVSLDLQPASVIVFSYSHDKEKAVKEAAYVKRNLNVLKRAQQEHVEKIVRNGLNLDDKTHFAYKCARNSINDLTVSIGGKTGIYAGLWWFSQFWARDEAISLKSLLSTGNVHDAKDILFRELSEILDDGRVPNRFPPTVVGNADGVGWSFLRVKDFIEYLEKEEDLFNRLSTSDILFLQQKLELTLAKLELHHNEDGFVSNGPQETWMDSLGDNGVDPREGMRIEIQALKLAMYQLMVKLSQLTQNSEQEKEFIAKEEEFREKVKEAFWNENYLRDGIGDDTVRPNVFLAAYIYPSLLSDEEWSQCFETVLEKLWLEWGGLASIDKDNALFCDTDTGEDSKSYHRGDSWFFVNNIAAIMMHRVDATKFKSYIDKILDASRKDIIDLGIVGHASEISSAKEQIAVGSLCQAWSAATFIELVEELYC